MKTRKRRENISAVARFTYLALRAEALDLVMERLRRDVMRELRAAPDHRIVVPECGAKLHLTSRTERVYPARVQTAIDALTAAIAAEKKRAEARGKVRKFVVRTFDTEVDPDVARKFAERWILTGPWFKDLRGTFHARHRK